MRNQPPTKFTRCTECDGLLFAAESQLLGVCVECREGDRLDDLDKLDLEDRLDAALADDEFAIPVVQPQGALL